MEAVSNRSLDATREAGAATVAHHKNIELLNALRDTQGEHTRILGEHTRILGEHSAQRDSIRGVLGQVTVGVHAIEMLLRSQTQDD